jgi:hypothetical protein
LDVVPPPILRLSDVIAWPGLAPARAQFRGRGFSAFKFIERELRELDKEGEDLDKYWDELAREILSSGDLHWGRGVFRDLRGFYRSPYLDFLLDKYPFGLEIGLGSIYPAVRDREIANLNRPRAQVADIINHIEDEKRREVDDYPALSTYDSLSLRGFSEILKRAGEELGYDVAREVALPITCGEFCLRILSASKKYQFLVARDSAERRILGRIPLRFFVASCVRGVESNHEFREINLGAAIPDLEAYLRVGRLMQEADVKDESLPMSVTIGIVAALEVVLLLSYGL